MYNISKGPSRFIRARRDLNLKLENLDQNRELSKKDFEDSESMTMNSPRPVFNVNSKIRSNGNRSPNSQEVISPQHEELIRYFNDAWSRVHKELEMVIQNGQDSRGKNGIIYYQGKSIHPALKNFEPFDLEDWWGKRMYQNLTQSA